MILPIILDLKKKADERRRADLVSAEKIKVIHDEYEDQVKEYFAVMNPELVYTGHFEKEYKKYLASLRKNSPLSAHGRWIYFPWNYSLVHILEDDAFQKVRTARNRDLITEEEQKKFYNSCIAIAGQSVGNSVALAIVLQGGGKHLKLADHDRLSLSNMNRIRCSVQNIGMPKIHLTAQQIYELNPYAEIELFPEGVTEKNISSFMDGGHKVDILVDEVDNLVAKFLLRQEAKKMSVPVVMGTDNGDNALIDIERYDQDPELGIFHGRLKKISYEEVVKMDRRTLGELIGSFIGTDILTERTHRSLGKIGTSIVSWPQLGGAALLNGSAVAYCVRKILTNQPVMSNRAHVSLDSIL